MIKTLDIVLPMYRPAPGWEERMIAHMRMLKQSFETRAAVGFILVNDGSPSELVSAEGLETIRKNIDNVRILEHFPNHGKGYALRRGVREAHADYVIYTDYDIPFGIESVVHTYDVLQQGFDVAAALRDETYEAALKCYKRRNITYFVRFMNRLLLRLDAHDAQAGLKGFNRRGRAVFLRTRINSFLFDTEFIAMCKLLHRRIRICDVHVRVAEGIVMSKTRFSVLVRESCHLSALILRALGRFCFSLKGIDRELD